MNKPSLKNPLLIPSIVISIPIGWLAFEAHSLRSSLPALAKGIRLDVDGSTIYAEVSGNVAVENAPGTKFKAALPEFELPNLNVTVDKLPTIEVDQVGTWSVDTDVRKMPPVTIQR